MSALQLCQLRSKMLLSGEKKKLFHQFPDAVQNHKTNLRDLC